MNKKAISVLVAVGFLVGNGLALAQIEPSTSVSDGAGAAKRIIEKKGEILQNINERREVLKQKQSEFQDKMKVSLGKLRVAVESKREELKTSLQKIKDEKKKQAVERLYNNFSELNLRLAVNWADKLDEIDRLVNNISSRADKAEANNIDVSAVRAAVSKAQSAIATARTEVAAQTAKNYPITISTENALKADVAAVRTKMNQDLKAVKDLVQVAHKGAVEALRLLKAIPGVNNFKIQGASNASSTEAVPLGQ